MDNELANKITFLEQRIELLSNQLKKALEYLEDDPHSSLTKSRTILEQILCAIYKVEMDQEPKKFEIGAILNDNQFTRKIDRRIISRMNSIRDMCNLGVHGEKVGPKDAKIVLDNLCEVLEWYFENYTTSKDRNDCEEDKYKNWISSLEKGSLKISIDTSNFLEVESLAEILFEVMNRDEVINREAFSEIDARNAQICLLELLNNVKNHVEIDKYAEVKIGFNRIGYRKDSVSIEVKDKGPGFNLEQTIKDNDRQINEGGREHGLLRAFRLGSDIAQKNDNGNIVTWRKNRTQRIIKDQDHNYNKEIIYLKYDFGFRDRLQFNSDFYSYQDFVKQVTKFSGSLLLSNFNFNLSNSIKITLDFLRKDPRSIVCLEFNTSHPTIKFSPEDLIGPEKFFDDLEPPVPSLVNIIYKFINEVTPQKKLVIACFTEIQEDHQYIKEFCESKSLMYFESRILYSEFLDNPIKEGPKSSAFSFFRFYKK